MGKNKRIDIYTANGCVTSWITTSEDEARAVENWPFKDPDITRVTVTENNTDD